MAAPRKVFRIEEMNGSRLSYRRTMRPYRSKPTSCKN